MKVDTEEQKDWLRLSIPEMEFTDRVGRACGEMVIDAYYYGSPLWINPTELGFIEPVGDYRWAVTEKYCRLEKR